MVFYVGTQKTENCFPLAIFNEEILTHRSALFKMNEFSRIFQSNNARLHYLTYLTLPFFRKNTSKYARIFQVCWFVCRKNLLTRDKPVFGDDSVFKLFRIFCLLADLVQDADDTNHYVVSELKIILRFMIFSLRCKV